MQRGPLSFLFALMQDALERAYTLDTGGQPAQAVKVYRVAVEAIAEGLKLDVPLTGQWAWPVFVYVTVIVFCQLRLIAGGDRDKGRGGGGAP